jgi:thiamine-monophosphate kinase
MHRSAAGHRSFDAGGPTLADVGEKELLRRLTDIASGYSTPSLVLGSGDDAAVWRPEPGTEVVITQDALVEGQDFHRSWIKPRQLGARALNVALSDLAGMGASPAWCTVTMCAPGSTYLADVLEIHRGLCQAAQAMGCAMAGGDVSDIDGPLVIDVSAGGSVEAGVFLRRDVGRPSDALLVTGTLGRAAAGLHILLDGPDSIDSPERELWLAAMLSPVARIAEGKQLLVSGVGCGGDMSDGLAVEAERIAESSGCGAEIWLSAVPVDAALQQKRNDWVSLALGGGEDFELIASLDPAATPELLASWPAGLAPLSVVGRLVSGSGVRILDTEGGAEVPLPGIASRHYR